MRWRRFASQHTAQGNLRFPLTPSLRFGEPLAQEVSSSRFNRHRGAGAPLPPRRGRPPPLVATPSQQRNRGRGRHDPPSRSAGHFLSVTADASGQPAVASEALPGATTSRYVTPLFLRRSPACGSVRSDFAVRIDKHGPRESARPTRITPVSRGRCSEAALKRPAPPRCPRQLPTASLSRRAPESLGAGPRRPLRSLATAPAAPAWARAARMPPTTGRQ
jgi:hypothetical protein